MQQSKICKGVNTLGSLDFRLNFYNRSSGDQISPWHDIPLKVPGRANNVYHYVNEIPKKSQLKMEINKESSHNPIIQDSKNGKPRLLTFGGEGIPFNYGAMPQTWEDPDDHFPEIQTKEGSSPLKGDNDPLDVVLFDDNSYMIGDIIPIRVVGCVALIDEGELDWKIIAVNDDNWKHHDIKDIAEISDFMQAVVFWFSRYKTADGKPLNEFAEIDGKIIFDASIAHKVIERTHERYRQLLKNGHKDLWIKK
ncbi:inorganic pyrophosphatase PPA [Acrasis kona]|uniref:inorganic diphosphatase n=1 Tax=Acrasis kona TaxID=1008807 RepID=A0AAW2ZIQ7_9EUKA